MGIVWIWYNQGLSDTFFKYPAYIWRHPENPRRLKPGSSVVSCFTGGLCLRNMSYFSTKNEWTNTELYLKKECTQKCAILTAVCLICFVFTIVTSIAVVPYLDALRYFLTHKLFRSTLNRWMFWKAEIDKMRRKISHINLFLIFGTSLNTLRQTVNIRVNSEIGNNSDVKPPYKLRTILKGIGLNFKLKHFKVVLLSIDSSTSIFLTSWARIDCLLLIWKVTLAIMYVQHMW